MHDRSPEAEQIPTEQAAFGGEMKYGTEIGVGTGEQDRILRQPFQRRVRGQRKRLVQLCLRARAAIKFARTGHGD